MELVMRYGYKRMTMDDIAKATGMSRPAVYLHFQKQGRNLSSHCRRYAQ